MADKFFFYSNFNFYSSLFFPFLSFISFSFVSFSFPFVSFSFPFSFFSFSFKLTTILCKLTYVQTCIWYIKLMEGKSPLIFAALLHLKFSPMKGSRLQSNSRNTRIRSIFPNLGGGGLYRVTCDRACMPTHACTRGVRGGDVSTEPIDWQELEIFLAQRSHNARRPRETYACRPTSFVGRWRVSLGGVQKSRGLTRDWTRGSRVVRDASSLRSTYPS